MKWMNVFISWSGVRSQAVAEALHDWLPQVMQTVRAWISSEDIRKGTQWGLALAEQLESTHMGVICLTPENLTAPWLLFEAGALSKLRREQDAHVCTYLIGLSYATVTGPLQEFQHTVATKDDTYRLVQTINAAMADGQVRLTDTDLKRAFERCWPELDRRLATLPGPQEPIPPPRKAEDMVQELLELVRSRVNPLPLFGYRPLLDQLGRKLEQTRSIADLSHSASDERGAVLARIFQSEVAACHDLVVRTKERIAKDLKDVQEGEQLLAQHTQEVNRLSSLKGLRKVKKARRPPAESEPPISAGSPMAQRKNRPAPKARQTRQRRRPS
jgi:TIR domain